MCFQRCIFVYIKCKKNIINIIIETDSRHCAEKLENKILKKPFPTLSLEVFS